MHENNYINRLRREKTEAQAEIDALKVQMAEALELVDRKSVV